MTRIDGCGIYQLATRRLFPFPFSFSVKRFICHSATLGNTMILREGKRVEGPKLY